MLRTPLDSRRSALLATGAYVAVAILMTWPLARRLTTALPTDLGDPGFNAWVLMWTGGQILEALRGNLSALGHYWDGNIFYPAELTIAYSEHMTPETLQALPFLAATGNIILGYNVVFLLTFVLAGLGMFLLVREWTGRPLAAFLAGLAYAYAPYRLGQLPHLQVLSTQWMPFVLYGLRRYFGTRRPRALAGAGAALVLQNLSCGYYLLYFPPFAAAYVLYELAARRRLRDRRVWLSMAAAAAGVAVMTLPFVLPYLRLRDISGVGVRPLAEIISFSADSHAFATPPVVSRLWAPRLPAAINSENEGFPGLTILCFALAGLVSGIARTARAIDWRGVPPEIRLLIGGAAAIFTGAFVVTLAVLVGSPLTLPFSDVITVVRGVQTPLQIATMTLAILIGTAAWLRRARPAGAGSHRCQTPHDPLPGGFSAVAALTAALLALGPRITSDGHRLGVGPYAWLLEYVPGFDGLRVPARFLMIVALFLAALAGIGAAWVERRVRRRGLATAIVLAGCTGILIESFMAPMPTNQPLTRPGLTPVRSLAPGSRLPPIYQVIRELPDPVVLLELPIGSNRADIPAVYYAGYHRRPIVNGYSGFAPPRYLRIADILMRADQDPPEVRSMLDEIGVTHVLVREGAFATARGQVLSDVFRSMGARLVTEDAGDKLFQVAGRR